MSQYSGKCDLCDWLEIYGGFENAIKRPLHIRVGYDSDEYLHFEKESDLMPYYPYVISFASSCQDGECNIVLMEESWVDHEEKEFAKYGLKSPMFDYYRKRLADDIEKQKEKEAMES